MASVPTALVFHPAALATAVRALYAVREEEGPPAEQGLQPPPSASPPPPSLAATPVSSTVATTTLAAAPIGFHQGGCESNMRH